MPPPPINWRTKPKSNQQRLQDDSQSSSLGTSQQPGAATDVIVPVYVSSARLREIEAALVRLGLPPLLSPDSEDQVEYHDHGAANSPGRHCSQDSELGYPNLSTSPSWLSTSDLTTSSLRVPMSDPTTSSSQVSTSDLTASFVRLSTSTSGSVQVPTPSFPVRPSPTVQTNPSPRKNMKGYYVVTIGKCTGVFWDEWDNVTPLVSGVSGARYKGFSTHNKAARFYLDVKEKGLVCVVRDPGDDALFSPLHEAMQ